MYGKVHVSLSQRPLAATLVEVFSSNIREHATDEIIPLSPPNV